MTRTSWTDELLLKVSQHARSGDTMREAAAALGIGLEALVVQASRRKIKFHGTRGPKPRDPSQPAPPRPLQVARQRLALELESALREWDQTPPYRGGP